MMTTITTMLAFLRKEEGLTIVEYAVAAGLIAAGAITAFFLLGGEVNAIINGLFTDLDANSPY
jgi:pilus assembly protein Flp/PilA